jgi:hypothetical protein
MASEPSADCKNLDLADRSCSTERFQIVLNDLDVAPFTRSAAELLAKDETRRIAANIAKLSGLLRECDWCFEQPSKRLNDGTPLLPIR